MLDRTRLLLRLAPAVRRMAAHRPQSLFTAGDCIERAAADHPDRTWLLFGDRTVSYDELNGAANRVAHWGIERGLDSGDRVALLMENRPDYVPSWAGMAKLGVTTALINTNLTGRALAHALTTAGAQHLILGAECGDRFATIAGDLDLPLEVWRTEDSSLSKDAPTTFECRDLDASLSAQPENNPDATLRETLRASDDLFYIYTSGTTGLPKAARFSHMRFLGIGALGAWAIDLEPDSVHYCALPLYHSAGGAMQVGAVLSVGATLALRTRFSASAFWDDVRRYRATHFQYIGEFCRYLMNQPPRPDDREHDIRMAIGNGLRPDIWEGFQQRFAIPHIREFYGATEGNLALVNLEDRLGSVGRWPFRFLTNARLIRYDVESDEHARDAEGHCIECDIDEVGELIGKIPSNPSRADGRFEGYTSREATERKILRDVFEPGDAYFRTGDLLRQDSESFFFFVDRIGDTFRWKGENVSTQEVAELLGSFPGLEMVNVYGVEVAGMDGRAGMAALLSAAGADFDAKAFHRFATEALPSYAVPVFVRLLRDAEVTGTFKLRKVTLQEEGFDPKRTSDPLLVRDDDSGSYIPLTPDLITEIHSGQRRL